MIIWDGSITVILSDLGKIRRSASQSVGPSASTRCAFIFFTFPRSSLPLRKVRTCALVFGVCFSAEQPRSFRRNSFKRERNMSLVFQTKRPGRERDLFQDVAHVQK